MMHKLKISTWLIVLFLSSIACADLRPGREVPSEADVPSGGVLFEDDFSDESSGWDRYRGDEGITDYENGAYRIVVHETQFDIWSNPYLDLTDTIIEVDATKTTGPDDNDFGVICRYQGLENFYYFIISSDGFYGIFKIKDGLHEVIQMDLMEYSSVINQGNNTNHIRADCIGDHLSLYVNGQLLTQSRDSDFSSGDVGLIAGTFDTPGTDILFDNFVVTKP